MFAIVIHDNLEPARRYTFAKREITLGRDPEVNDIVLQRDSVSPRHARLVVQDGKYILIDLKSDTGTFVKHRRMTSPLIIKLGQAFAIGGYALALDEVVDLPLAERGTTSPPSDAVEAELVAAIVRNDDASRLVYADWLEERGRAPQAEFLRLQEQLARMAAGDPAFAIATGRLRELAEAVDIHWRVQVARSPVAHCAVKLDFRCSMEWAALAPTRRSDVRHCGACREDVYYCASVAEARAHAATGACVAIDLSAPRWEDDLGAPYGEHVCSECGLDAGPTPRYCPRCAEDLHPQMVIRRGLVMPR